MAIHVKVSRQHFAGANGINKVVSSGCSVLSLCTKSTFFIKMNPIGQYFPVVSFYLILFIER